jgi:hypothetical protein
MRTIPEAAPEEAEELFASGWIPDIPCGRTHWLHRTLAPVLGVSTARALERNRANKRYKELLAKPKESSK